jgi:predicted ATPase
MDILAALKQEEAKFEKQVNAAQQQLDTVRAAIKLLGGVNGSGKATASSSAKTTASSRAKTTGGKKRVMSAAARARISKATKERWAKFRAAKAKGKN